MRTTQKYTFEEVVKHFKSQGCELLDKEYVNAHHPMQYRCKCGAIGTKQFYAFKSHPNCDACGKTSKLNPEEVSQYYVDQGCKLLEPYDGNGTPLKFECKCGVISTRTFKNFKKHPQCSTCSGKHRHSFEEVKTIFEKSGCQLLATEYRNCETKLPYLCKCGTESKITFDDFQHGKRCKECGLRKGENNGRWNPDRELVELNMRVSSRSHAHLKYLLKLQGKKKDDHARAYLGYTVAELRSRITNHDNWVNLKGKKWHIDHIFPIKAFLDHGVTDLKIINSLDNLRPLLAEKNLKKGAKYSKRKFREWIASKGIILP